MGQFSASKWWQCLPHFAVLVMSLQGAYFAGVGAPANQEYSIQIPAYFSLDIATLTQIWQCPQIPCFTTSHNRAIIPPANISGLIQPQGSTASWPKGHGVVTDPALRKLCLGSFFSGNFNRAVLGLTEKKGRYQSARKCLSEWIHSCRLTARHESRKGSRSTFLVYQKI